MEFNQKLQELRRQRGITQEELASELYVSRTAISKWELGKGYPSIDSLKAIAKFYKVTLDELLSPSEIVEIAEKDEKQKKSRLKDIVFGLIDIAILLLAFLPIFALRIGDTVSSVSLFSLEISAYIKASYYFIIFALSIFGIIEISLQGVKSRTWSKIKLITSVLLGAVAVITFTVSLQPYPAILSFLLLSIKASVQIFGK